MQYGCVDQINLNSLPYLRKQGKAKTSLHIVCPA